MYKEGSVFQIERNWIPSKTKTASATKAAEELHIESEIPDNIIFSDDYVYSTVRAISARVNLNMDGFMKEELLGTIPELVGNNVYDKIGYDQNLKPHNDKFGYRTFIDKYNHVDHFNQPVLASEDPRHEPRGKILWSWYEEDDLEDEVRLGPSVDPVTKMAGKDCWVKLLIANDRRKFPVLCRAIEDGIVTKVSMGAEVVGSTCSVCGQFAAAPWEYCQHVRFGRGQPFTAQSGSHFVQSGVLRQGDPVLAFENNHGLQFFEESWILDIQADPTAVIMDLIKAEPGMSLRNIAASKTAGKKDYNQILLDLINSESDIKESEIEKIAQVLRKEAVNPNVNIQIDNIEELVDQKRNGSEETENEFDPHTAPYLQSGEFFPDRPFPCSARVEASEANPEYPMDTTINIDVCQGCMYNKSDKVGAVDCSFPEVVREGGGDPLPTGFEPPGSEDAATRDMSSGIKNEEGYEIPQFPEVQHPPGTAVNRAAKLAAFYRLKAMLDVGTGTWKIGETVEDTLIKNDMGRPMYPNNKNPEEIDSYNHSVGISIPSNQVSGDPVDSEGRKWVINSIKNVMAKEFGGVDVQGREGGWVDEGNYHADDKITIVSDTDDLEKAKAFIQDLAYAVEDAFNQYAIEFFIDGKRYFTRDVH